MADLRKRFGELLAAHRRRRGMTQEDLAEAAGLSVDMISKIEVGHASRRLSGLLRRFRLTPPSCSPATFQGAQ
jgi:transcriptional regulator with XRE-family HTH domain